MKNSNQPKTATRKDYLDNKVSHREYYAQYVTQDIKNLVLSRLSKEEIIEAVKAGEHLNTIRLSTWDSMTQSLSGVSDKLKANGDGLTLAVGVCILKEAAKQIAEEI